MKKLLMKKLLKSVAPFLAGAAAWSSNVAPAYVEIPYALGRIVTESTNIVYMKVESVDKQQNLVTYRKIKDLKGTHPTEVIKHNIGNAGHHPREWQFAMEGAQPGTTAVFFHNGGASQTYVTNYWYQAYAGDWWAMSHGEPFFLRSYAGKPDKLASAVTAMLEGQEVIVPCMVDGDKDALQLRTGKIQRLRASLRLQEYDAKRDFVGWGNEDFRLLAGMPGFTHYAGVVRTDPEAAVIRVVDFDGDGKTDVLMTGAGKVVLLKYTGSSLEEVSLPYGGGARGAAWGDWNADGKPDLLLAAPAGPVLLTNKGEAAFKDDSPLLPREAFYALTTAAWIDQDGDGREDVLLANGFLGLRLYRNKRPAAGETKAFEDVSARVGLGQNGLAAGAKGFHLAVADLDGDKRQDFLYTAGSGMLVKNTAAGFVEEKKSGIAFKPGKVAPALADFDGDGKVDITLVDGNLIKLFKNDGRGRFSDSTGQLGDLAGSVDQAACLFWSDFHNQGRPDLLVGALRGPNRLFRNLGDGKFADASEEIGLTQKVFNTRAICVVDLNNDQTPDLVFNNEGRESSVLMGDPRRWARKTAGAE